MAWKRWLVSMVWEGWVAWTCHWCEGYESRSHNFRCSVIRVSVFVHYNVPFCWVYSHHSLFNGEVEVSVSGALKLQYDCEQKVGTQINTMIPGIWDMVQRGECACYCVPNMCSGITSCYRNCGMGSRYEVTATRYKYRYKMRFGLSLLHQSSNIQISLYKN